MKKAVIEVPLKEGELTIPKKKDKNALLALSGATRGKLGPFIEKEDRADVRE